MFRFGVGKEEGVDQVKGVRQERERKKYGEGKPTEKMGIFGGEVIQKTRGWSDQRSGERKKKGSIPKITGIGRLVCQHKAILSISAKDSGGGALQWSRDFGRRGQGSNLIGPAHKGRHWDSVDI